MRHVGRIERIDQPDTHLWSISIFSAQKKQFLLISVDSNRVELCLSRDRPTGRRAESWLTAFRSQLVDGMLGEIRQSSRCVELIVHRGPRRLRWIVTSTGSSIDDQGKIIVVRGAPHEPAREHLRLIDIDSVPTTADDFLRRHRERARSARVAVLLREERRRLKRIERRIEALERDLHDAELADNYFYRAQLLTANLHRASSKDDHLVVDDWQNDMRPLRLSFDVGLDARAQAQRWFDKAQKLKRKHSMASSRLTVAQTEAASIEQAIERIESASDEQLEKWVSHFDQAAHAPRSKKGPPKRTPYREVFSEDGTPIWVGRNARDNDELTLRLSRPFDHWLHAKSIPGSHVLLRLGKSQTHSPEALLDAATLAAYFSDAKHDTIVDVVHTPKRYVRKRKGSARGQVQLDQFKVIAVRMQSERVERLMRSRLNDQGPATD
ncbi:MAG: NFACT RNA binding domain-containing protein [Polyangiales bacterium]